MLIALAASVALGGSAHWALLPVPDGVERWVDVVADGERVVGLDAHGAAYRRDPDGEWRRWLAPPEGPAPDALVRAPSGGGGGWQDDPPSVYRVDGAEWGRREVPGDLVLTGLVVDREGWAWASAYAGTTYARAGSGWAEVPGWGEATGGRMIRDVGVAGPRALWLLPADQALVRAPLRGEAEPVVVPTGATRLLAVTADGRPLMGRSGLHRLDPAGWVELSDERTTQVACGPRRCAARSPGRVWWFDAEGAAIAEAVLADVPSEPRRLIVTAEERLFALDRDGRLFEARPGTAPELRDVAADWGVAEATDVEGASAGDVDGDGLDDLVVVRDGAAHLLVQRGRAFVDVTPAWRLDLHPEAGSLALCDLDGNGQHDLVGREGDRIRVLRALDGWFDDVTGAGGVAVDVPPTVGRLGAISCPDLDGDGDRDLVVPGLFAARNAVFENLGHGRMARRDLDEPLLAAAGHWTSAVLAGDLDGDRRDDVLFVDHFTGGNALIGDPLGVPIDHTDGSGLGRRGWFDSAWALDVDGDHVDEVVLLDRRRGPLVLRRGADGVFDDLTGELMSSSRWEGAFRAVPSVVADLDLDGAEDLAACDGDGCRLYLAADGRLVERPGALPPLGDELVALTRIDLGGDGDADLLVTRRGTDRLLESAASEVASAPPPGWPGPQIARRLAWARLWPDGVLAALWLASVVLAHLVASGRGAALVVGRRVGMAAVALGGAAVQVAGLDRTPTARAVAVAVLCLGLGLSTALEVKLDAWRRARRVAGHRLLRMLGRGGMGTVYLARQEPVGRLVALKLVRPDLLESPQDRELYQREARLGASMDDPRLVQIVGWGEWTVMEHGQPRPTGYLVMELLSGASLRQVLRSGGPMPADRAAAVVREVALGLHALHLAGVVHRDVKPENVMLLRSGAIKVMDFGAARQMGQVETGRGVLGTPGYLSPEQVRGMPPDPRVDVFAAGVMLYELVVGRRPWAAAHPTAMLAGSVTLPERPDEIGPELWRVVVGALALDPSSRTPSAHALADQLAAFAAVEGPRELARTLPRAAPIQLAGQPLQGRGPSLVRVLARTVAAWWRLRGQGRSPGGLLLAAELLEEAAAEDPGRDQDVPAARRRLERVLARLTDRAPEAAGPSSEGVHSTWSRPSGPDQ